ncbi:bifunctional proline dehydrogenase/L-glutamate gamma-semialdehyde dehydrogenase [Planctomonas sp. JC2975]|uniref:proline dehydrogenase family protein n=1 Tax=Planctomonas sp. JC2975 TaxID=2729626 RepID=UPI0014749D0B|nr:bifunctional proline dehydrogenase/L-glutamate gamma-semialdehyde dehydrogenase [Planctomonas sp. JC2975]NNC12739.1 bifunctional proline dehydrogenase/L-glutamate gamma-semialdehyde dehydrogenase [Planctomonas sp. JC2975]
MAQDNGIRTPSGPLGDGGSPIPDDDLGTRSIELVRAWLQASDARDAIPEASKRDPAAERLAGLLRDPRGLDFAVGFVDGVARPQDVYVAAKNLHALARRIPRFLPWIHRAAIAVGGTIAPAIPWIVIPIARRVLRSMVGHLIVDATPARLGTAIARLRDGNGVPGGASDGGVRLNLNLLGEAVLGENEADARLEGTRELLEREDVDYVSIKVSSVASQLSMWAFDESVARVVQRLAPLYLFAAASPTPKFINLDMEEYHDLDLTIAVFKRLLGDQRLLGLEAGIVLQAYLPDALDALQDLTEWALHRRAAGGAPIKVRIVKGANLPMERVDAAVHGWPLAPYDGKVLTDANYKRVLDWALTPEHTHAVKIGVAGHNLFDVAHAWLLARSRGVDDRIDFEMLLGMATRQADAVAGTVGGLLLYAPVVHPRHFDVAISYLMRRLQENAADEDFLSAAFELTEQPSLFEREKARFLASLAELEGEEGPRGLAPLPNRRQDRAREWVESDPTTLFHPRPAPVDPAAEALEEGLTGVVLGLDKIQRGSGLFPTTGVVPLPEVGSVAPDAFPEEGQAPQDRVFRNESDTDPSLPSNRAWGRRILSSVSTSTAGEETLARSRVDDERMLDHLLAGVQATGAQWGAISGNARAATLDRVGLALSANRDRLIEVMASETGKTIAEADPEVSEAVDFAHYYAALARELDTVQGARFVPSQLTVVTPPWNFPVSIPAGSVLGPLAAGSGVVLKPAPQARRCAAVLAECFWEAGISRDLLVLADVEEGALGQALIANPRVDRVILTGAYDTAKLFKSWRPDLPLLAETSGKNAIIVTPSADVDLAVADVVKSAFSNAGQKCSAASLVILVGSMGSSRRFLDQLADAAESVYVGWPEQPVSWMGPLIEPARGKLAWALTELEEGEEWLVTPRNLDDTGRLWSPGIRTGVQPGSRFHRTEFFGPVLGVMHARTLEQAVELQNAVDYGLTAGLHSLDPDEIEYWTSAVEAGNLYVNRGITGAIVQRQPFGGWKRSSVGAGHKAGGPNYLFGLGSWVGDAGASSSSLHLRGLDSRVTRIIEAGQPSMSYEEFDLVRRSALSDAIAWANEFGVTRDAADLGVERNLFRYRPASVSIRLSEGVGIPALLRVLAAAALVRGRFDVSTPTRLPRPLREALHEIGTVDVVESDAAWLQRVYTSGVSVDSESRATDRVRLIGGDASGLAQALGERIDVAVFSGPVTASGRVELLPFLREQAISITNHRFGSPTALTADIL